MDTKSKNLPEDNRRDLYTILLLFIFGVFFYFLGISELEYFRHTEADRMLIGFEMFKSKNFLVPRLLESVILTKPPLFYWLVSLFIYLFNSMDEWVSRIPSAISALSLGIIQFLVLRKVFLGLYNALLGSLMLLSGGAMFILSVSGEIDMVFCLFSTLSLYSLFFSMINPRKGVLISYIFASLAFLTKGPQIVFFYASTFIFFEIWLLFCSSDEQKIKSRKELPYLIWQHFLGVFIFLVIVGGWIFLLSKEVGVDALISEFKDEVVNRVVNDSNKERGAFFYFGALFKGLLPWSFVLLIVAFVSLTKKIKFSFKEVFLNYNYRGFFVFSLIVVLFSLIMLSFSSGKSNRYIFPVYAFSMNLLLSFWLMIKDKGSKEVLRGILEVIFLVLSIFSFLPLFLDIFSFISLSTRIFISVFLGISSFSMFFLLKRNYSPKLLFINLCFLLVGVRIFYQFEFVQYRNKKYSVKNVAYKIDSFIPENRPLYTIEMFERWVVYYIIKDKKRRVLRLNPLNVRKLSKEDGDIYILIQVADEAWRLKQLGRIKSPKIVSKLENTKNPMYLIKASKNSLKELNLSLSAPTEISKIPNEL